MSVFRVILVQIQENADQNNSEYGHFFTQCKGWCIEKYKFWVTSHALLGIGESESSHRRYSVKINVLNNFTNFTGKHLCWSLFLIKKNFIKKRVQHRCFSARFGNFLRTSILKNICERPLLENQPIERKR